MKIDKSSTNASPKADTHHRTANTHKKNEPKCGHITKVGNVNMIYAIEKRYRKEQ